MHKAREVELQPACCVLPPKVESEPVDRVSIAESFQPLQHHRAAEHFERLDELVHLRASAQAAKAAPATVLPASEVSASAVEAFSGRLRCSCAPGTSQT